MNVHNHELDARDRGRVRAAWRLHRDWAAVDYAKRTVIAMGGFNAVSRPPDSSLQPQAARARLLLDNDSRRQQAFLKA
eukprot:4448278-Pyramimonas_sp.AAC.1